MTIYEGNYFSEEANSTVSVQKAGVILSIRFRAGKVYQLIPIYKDAFKIDELGCELHFIRSSQNKLSAIKFYFWRTKDIGFEKLK